MFKGDNKNFVSRARYRFDTAFSAGTAPVIGVLGVATLVLVVGAGFVLSISDVSVNAVGNKGLIEDIWTSLMRTLDPGTMGSDNGWTFRIVTLSVTICGILILSTLIGLLSHGVDRSLARLSKGRSVVHEKGHVVILGWSSHVPTIVEQLVQANLFEKRARVVLLAPLSKEFIEDQIRLRVEDLQGLKLIVRTGDPSDVHDLDIVRPFAAKAIIVVSPDGDIGDASVIRSVLALLKKDKSLHGTPTIAEFTDSGTAQVVRSISDGAVITVVPSEIIARISARICKTRGVSDIYQDLLDFEGHEIYIRPVEKRLVGMPLADAILAYDEAAVIGFERQDGSVRIAADLSEVLPPECSIIAVAEHSHLVRFSGTADPVTPASIETGFRPPVPERYALLGWNKMAPQVLRELDVSSAPGSMAVALVTSEAAFDETLVKSLTTLKLDYRVCDADDPDALSSILDFDPDHILVLCEHDERIPSEADALVLMSVLKLDHLMSKSERRPNIIAELRDPRDSALAAIARADDLVVSDHLACLIMAQLAESPHLAEVFDAMFSNEGPLIEVISASSLGDLTQMATHNDLVRAGLERNQLVLGYRKNGSVSPSSALQMVPRKSQSIQADESDQVVVMHIQRDQLDRYETNARVDLVGEEELQRQHSIGFDVRTELVKDEFTGATLGVAE